MCVFACVTIACARTATTQTELRPKVVRAMIMMQKPTLQPTSTTTSDVNDNVRNDAERPRIVVNELLSFVAYKLNLMAPDTIVQLCSSFYDEMEIDSAKALLYDLCADRDDRQDRMIKRSSGPRKKSLSMKDIVSLFTRKHDSITVSFVAAALWKLPPIGFNNLDVSLCTLLAQIQATVAELDMVKANVATQAVTCIQLQAAVTKQGTRAVRDSERDGFIPGGGSKGGGNATESASRYSH